MFNELEKRIRLRDRSGEIQGRVNYITAVLVFRT